MFGTAAMLWVASGGVGDIENAHGRGAGLVRMLGPQGLAVLGGSLAVLIAIMALLYLRRAFGERIAARAEPTGLAIYSIFGRRFFPWAEIERVEIQHRAGQAFLKVITVPGAAQGWGLAMNGLAEDVNEVEQWIGAAYAVGRHSH